MKTNKIHILHIVDGLIMGGAEVMITQIIKALGTEKYEHFVYYFANDGPIRQKLEKMGTPVYKGKVRASIKQPTKFVATLFDLARDLMLFIRCKRIQVIQSHMAPANRLAVAVGKLTRTPTFPTIHTPFAFEYEMSRWDIRIYFKKALDQFTYRISDKVLVVSQEIREKIQQCFGLEENKILLLKNGIVLEDKFWESDGSEKIFQLSEKKLKIIAVGRLVPLKNFDVLIRAVKDLIDRDLKNIFVNIAGEGEERIRLETLINELEVGNYVKLLGLSENVIELMQASNLFVMSSSYEGLSIAMIEAMACGLPIISSDIGGVKDCIRHEQNGLIFPVGDHKTLADCILRLFKDEKLRMKLAHGARRSFETNYDMRNNIESLDTLFQKYCNRN